MEEKNKMAILFGDTRPDGKIRVWRTIHTKHEGKNIVDVKKEDYPDGYEFSEMPEYPAEVRGKEHIWLFDPKTGEHSFETNDRKLTPDEVMEEINEKLGVLITKLDKDEVVKK